LYSANAGKDDAGKVKAAGAVYVMKSDDGRLVGRISAALNKPERDNVLDFARGKFRSQHVMPWIY
jgi:hypothetical protein